MAELSYTAIASLDRYVEDADGRFDWAATVGAVSAKRSLIFPTLGTRLRRRR